MKIRNNQFNQEQTHNSVENQSRILNQVQFSKSSVIRNQAVSPSKAYQFYEGMSKQQDYLENSKMFKDDYSQQEQRINVKIYLKCLYQGIYDPVNYGKPLNLLNYRQIEQKYRVLSAYKKKLRQNGNNQFQNNLDKSQFYLNQSKKLNKEDYLIDTVKQDQKLNLNLKYSFIDQAKKQEKEKLIELNSLQKKENLTNFEELVLERQKFNQEQNFDSRQARLLNMKLIQLKSDYQELNSQIQLRDEQMEKRVQELLQVDKRKIAQQDYYDRIFTSQLPYGQYSLKDKSEPIQQIPTNLYKQYETLYPQPIYTKYDQQNNGLMIY